jgi:hypothetical protein
MSRWDEAERHFERALEMNTRMGTRPWVAHTQHDYARMLSGRRDSRDDERARQLLEAAQGAYEQLGMTTWAKNASADLASLN